jgi:hypothetical protein
MDKRVGVLGTAFAVAAASATCATAAPSNVTQYRAQVNALCRSYTPRMKRAEAAMRAAQKAGDAHKTAYEVGVLLGASLAEGIRVEATPVPADARMVMAKPLRLLRLVDSHARTMLQAAVAGDQATFSSEATTLQRVGAPLNHALDAAGLRDCGSNQT